MKQTAVEWLVNCIESMDWGEIITRKELYAKAKAMEKQQIVDAITFTIVGSNDIYDKVYPEIIYTAEQYFNETFKAEE